MRVDATRVCGSMAGMSQPLSSADLPAYWQLILPAIKAVEAAGGSATSAEVEDGVLAALDPSDDELAVMQPNRPSVSVYVDRVKWGRSYAKLIGALESPRRGMFMMAPLGRELLGMPEDDAVTRIRKLDREYRRNRRHEAPTETDDSGVDSDPAGEDPVASEEGDTTDTLTWREILWSRLHEFTPQAFEEFVLLVLREYGMNLERVGGTGDEGIDGIGTARITPILSSRVAVQIKRYNPDGKPVGREVVALLQRDAAYIGAERAILVTLGRFSEPAKRAAIATTPTVELIDGKRLTDLMLEKKMGVKVQPVVDEPWLARFQDGV